MHDGASQANNDNELEWGAKEDQPANGDSIKLIWTR
jgi:hypothetical protein